MSLLKGMIETAAGAEGADRTVGSEEVMSMRIKSFSRKTDYEWKERARCGGEKLDSQKLLHCFVFFLTFLS